MKDDGERHIPELYGYNLNHFRHMAAYNFAAKFVKNKFVLDDGCGAGYGSFYLRTQGAKEVLGMDISADAINYCHKRYSYGQLGFSIMSSTNLGFRDGCFDVVVSFQVI